MRPTSFLPPFLVLVTLLAVSGRSVARADSSPHANPSAYIPPQCYTKTLGESGAIHNTCYPCHTAGFRPEFTNDADFQLTYDFAAPAETNPWSNFLKEHGVPMTAIDDRQMRDLVRRSNYLDAEGGIALSAALRDPPARWDPDGDGRWSGYVPDCFFNFDAEGFDRAPSGNHTGWRALAFYPFPSTHWPTNGAFSDVALRLPAAFRTRNQRFDLQVYKTNLAILEALIKRQEVTIPETDEAALQVDLDKDGRIGRAIRIAYDWAPVEGRHMSWVGDARDLQRQGKIHLAAGLFPEGTEFLNTLRYLDVGDDASVRIAPRMKEVRYLKKRKWLTYAELETLAMNDIKEKNDFPDRLRLPSGSMEQGLSNSKGWVAQGFIEDRDGSLRPQSIEETLTCIGCHGGIGATTDSTFSLPRKLDASSHQGGWFHWSQRSLEGINEPKVEYEGAGVQYEYSFYLMYATSGDEFRANNEVRDRFFDLHGHLKPDMAQKLHEDISILLLPSPKRAMALNKAYSAFVAEQSFRLGREPLTGGAASMHRQLKESDRLTGVSKPVTLSRLPRDASPGPLPPPVATPLESARRQAVSGKGLSGPDGTHYSLMRSGQIDQSAYAMNHKGFYFPFPPRHTLPTRIIVPNGAMTGCYDCHRLAMPMPPGDPRVSIPIALPASAGNSAGLKRLTDHPGSDVGGVWSPDGRSIAWTSDRGGTFQIWVMGRDGSQPRQITHGPSLHGWPAWSPDGTRLAYWGYDERTGETCISISGMDGEHLRTLARTRESLDRPTWRPDGRYIAYAELRSGNWDIWVSAADGSSRHRLTHDAQMETNPLWSPDGSVIAYKAAPGKEYNLTIENFISVRDGFESPRYRYWDGIKSIQMNDWSPDGRRIAYTAEMVTNASGEDRVSYLTVVEEISLTGSKTSSTPVPLSGNLTLGDRGPVFSPSGERVCFWAWDRSYRAGLWIANSDGSGLKQLTSGGMDMVPRWSPDGKTILFESGRGGNMEIWSMVLD